MQYSLTDATTFAAHMYPAVKSRGPHGHSVSAPPESAKLYLAADGMSGFALDGETLCAVWSHKDANGRLAGMVAAAAAIAAGLPLLIDCFAPLAPIYERHGFVEYGRDQWADEYAPKGWDYAELGRPDVVYMVREPRYRVAAIAA